MLSPFGETMPEEIRASGASENPTKAYASGSTRTRSMPVERLYSVISSPCLKTGKKLDPSSDTVKGGMLPLSGLFR